jgi:hypothetical protein
MKVVGWVLLALGVLGLVYGGFKFSTRETVLDIGPIHATANREHNVPIAPIAGVLMLVAGGALLMSQRRVRI